jgi:hypothetical protein
METAKKGEKGDGLPCIRDWGISECTLEEIFATVTTKVEANESAKFEAEMRNALKGITVDDTAHSIEKQESEAEIDMEFSGAPGFSSWGAAFSVHSFWLVKKNFLIYKRNMTATGLLLFAGVFIMLILLVVDLTQGAGGGDSMYFGAHPKPATFAVEKIQQCSPTTSKECRSIVVYRPLVDQYEAGSDTDAKIASMVAKLVKTNGLPEGDVNGGVKFRRYNASDPLWATTINEDIFENPGYTDLVITIPRFWGFKVRFSLSSPLCLPSTNTSLSLSSPPCLPSTKGRTCASESICSQRGHRSGPIRHPSGHQ